MKKIKNNKRNFKNKTLLADTKEDKVTNRVIYEKQSSDVSENSSLEEGYNSGDEQEIEPIELTRTNFNIKLTMIVIIPKLEFQPMRSKNVHRYAFNEIRPM
jgi:hypothetical protein